MKTVLLLGSIALFPVGISAESTIWKLDNLKKIGGHKIEIVGQPKVIKTDNGKAIEFDGVDDGISSRQIRSPVRRRSRSKRGFGLMLTARRSSVGFISKILRMSRAVRCSRRV